MKTLSINKHRAKADKVFSEYIRKRDKGVCYTCGTKRPWKEMQAGHFVSRSHNSLRFSEINVRCQDAACNIFKYGNMPIFAQKLLAELGEKGFNDLIAEGKKSKQFTHQELDQLIDRYKEKC